MIHRILIVDDRQENIIALEETLEELGNDVQFVRALSGNEAVAHTINRDFALILMDVQMPDMDGFEAAELIRKDKKNGQVPIIFVTAISKEDRYVFKGYHAGAVDYLFKPLDQEILLSKVKVFLELARQRQELERTLAELSQLHQRHQLMLDCAAEGVLGIDRAGMIIFANPAARSILHIEENDLIGAPLNDFLTGGQEKNGECPAWEASGLYAALNRGQVVHNDDDIFRTFQEDSTPVAFSCAPIQGGDCFDGAVLIFQDISKRKQMEQQLLDLANNDPLTGLANRNVFASFQARAMARARRAGNEVAVLFLDLDNFKIINDTLGHDTGDLLLQSVAKRLMDCRRESDLVVRLGGDEFALILEDCSPEGASHVAENILRSLDSPHLLNGNEIFASTSIGIAISTNAGDTPEEINKAADAAMYNAKEQGRNNYQFFDPQMHRQAIERLEFETELRSAVEEGSFDVHYQPQIDMATGEIVALEALLRWEHNKFGTVFPAKFIPIAEKCGLISSLGEWVLDNACQTHAGWIQNFNGTVNLRVAINVSIRQLKDKEFFSTIKKVLSRSKLSPSHLEIEVTESTVMDDPKTSIDVLGKIQALGVRIAIDDFGTGYSSLSYLQRLPIDTVKIDLSFIRDIGIESGNEKIIKVIIALAKSLNMRLIAEGVETREQLDFLVKHGCNLMQGYYFSHPLSSQVISDQIAEHGRILVNSHGVYN